ncbi:hypothetical protein AQUCO_03700239v1 [Aquilegia coerulea]|uniref:Uncharacterized protein n=2 Tax=Aquilegia coerulea TaxID=218851 RepID=A0A2G5CU75_AQUCA|nr:hypothetical protein AQUCO_03700239v1 [Aquilegia coerulea]
MAASFLLPSLPCINRTRDSFFLQPNHLVKNVMHVLVHISQPKCSIKLYKVPHRVGSKCAIRCSVTTGSLQGNPKEYDIFSAVSAPNTTSRSKTLLDCSSNSVNDFERQLQEFFLEVKTMLEKRNIDGAVNILQANYEAVKEQINEGANGMEQAAILDIIAMGYMSMREYKIVENLLEMLQEIVGSAKNDDTFLDSVLLHMGTMYAHFRKYEKAMVMYERSLDILKGLFGSNSTFLIPSLLGMAKVYTSIGRTSKAVEFYHRALNILEMGRGDESEDIVVPLAGLGNLFIKGGKAADAENCFNRIVRTYAKLYGDHDGRVGMAMCSLANAKCAKGSLDDAIELYTKGLQVIKDSNYLALDDPVMEKIRVDLADLCHTAGREHEGRELLKECLLITEEYKGREHVSSVTHLLNLATSYSRSKNFVEAERLQREGLRIMEMRMGPHDPSITVPMLSLAVTLYHLKRDIEAEHYALEAVGIRERAFGDKSLPVAEALDCLVSIQTRIGKDDAEVLALLKRILSVQEKEFGYESEEVVNTLKKVVFYLDKLGRKNEKLPLQRRLSMLRTKYKEKVYY